MRLSWPQHFAAARTIELAGDDQCGTALALMGMAWLLLLQDLSDTAERPDPACGPAEGKRRARTGSAADGGLIA